MYLNCHSYYSLRYGTIPVDDLVVSAAEKGIRMMALTDINVTTGIFDFIKACRKYHIHPVVGLEFRQDNQLRYTGLAKNNEGFHELNKFLTYHNVQKLPLPEMAPEFDNVFIVYPVDRAPLLLKDYEYIGIRIKDRYKAIYSGRTRG